MTREQTCQSTARKLSAAAEHAASIKAVVGLDGFVDEIAAVVEKRQGVGQYQPVRTIADFSRKIAAAAGQSSNYELVVKQTKIGGNGPIMANALATAGLSVTYIGALGYPNPHPVFADFAGRVKAISVAEPAHTDALEFEDGKLMLNKLVPFDEVNWDNLMNRLGHDRLKELLDGARLIGMVNWTMLPNMSRIWAKLLDEVIPNSERHTRRLFVDLADPEKRTADDIVEALGLLRRMQDQVDVILGLNRKESLEIADVLGMGKMAMDTSLSALAAAIRKELKLACVVIHPRRGAAAAGEETAAWFDGPFVRQPRISTGAGDHFNAGFCLGQVLGLDLQESLCAGCGVSGYYVRTAQSPTLEQLADFVRFMPTGEAEAE